MPETRSSKPLGAPAELSGNMLPTISDVLNYCLFVRDLKKKIINNKLKNVFSVVAEKVFDIWQRASIPTLSKVRVITLVKEHYSKYKKLKKTKIKKGLKSHALESFLENSSKLFDICSCKCEPISECSCEKNKKVPKKEIDFLLDQRTSRNMVIGKVDIPETIALQKRSERQLRDKRPYKKKEAEEKLEQSSIRKMKKKVQVFKK